MNLEPREVPVSDDAARRQLLALILETFERREITLSSGKKSNFYLDCRRPLMTPLGQKLAGELLHEKLAGGPPVDAVGGMAVGAVPLVSGEIAEDLANYLLQSEQIPSAMSLGVFVRSGNIVTAAGGFLVQFHATQPCSP